MRVYLPATWQTLRALNESGAAGGAGEAVPITAFAVTPGLREWYAADDDIEELEYAAFAEAARASLRLLTVHFGAPPRRVVLAADVPDGDVEIRDDLDRGVVRLPGALEASGIASIHIDEADAETAVAAAAAAIDRADMGDDEAQDIVDDAEGFELSWYAPQELTHVLDTLT